MPFFFSFFLLTPFFLICYVIPLFTVNWDIGHFLLQKFNLDPLLTSHFWFLRSMFDYDDMTVCFLLDLLYDKTKKKEVWFWLVKKGGGCNNCMWCFYICYALIWKWLFEPTNQTINPLYLECYGYSYIGDKIRWPN